MTRIVLFLSCFLLLGGSLNAQRLEKFPEGDKDFLNELTRFVTASKTKSTEELMKLFNELVRDGKFAPEEISALRETGDLMLNRRLSAQPYFTSFIQVIIELKNHEDGAEKVKNWQQLVNAELQDEANFKTKPFLDFIKFSNTFFAEKALRYSSSGVNWVVFGGSFEMEYVDGKPKVKYPIVNLLGYRKADSILITQTSGYFDPVDGVWHGEGGKVTWERLGLDPEVYVELGPYELETKKSLYKVAKAKLHYPAFFGTQTIEGRFEDKISSNTSASGTSFPRFESFGTQIEVRNFGKGINYRGGFRLQGATIYGFGSREEKAKIEISDVNDNLTFKGFSELFTIKQEERISGQGVNCTVYLDQDSIYHPSVNLRFEVVENKLELSRGERGSDRNPFFSSIHQMNIEAEKINYYIDQDSIIIGERRVGFSKRVSPVVFESLKFFEISDYNRLQNIADINPIAMIKAIAENENTRFMNANDLAYKINSKFTVENIQTLLYDLVSKGFINYDSETEMVEVKEKTLHYADAARNKVDYDLLRIQSESMNTNAVFDLKNNTILATGVSNVEFSRPRRVALKPYGDQVVIKSNRDLDFDGKLFAGLSTLTGKDFHFSYETFQVELDSVRFFDLFVLSDSLDRNEQRVPLSIDSRIEHLEGFLLIDAPSNKSGRQDIEIFPSFQSKKNSFVYYDDYETQSGVYKRDSFYFELKPFSFNGLDEVEAESINFKGRMYSWDIFPEFDETLILMEEDQSLGFISPTPEEGYPNYQGKGNYEGDIFLSNKGFQGEGTLSYLGAVINSDDIIFRPKQLVGTAERFDLEEDRSSVVEVPQAKGVDVEIDWRPYKDSMYIESTEKTPFDLFKDDLHYLSGTLILTPGGLKGRGTFGWDKADMRSKLFSFGAHSTSADTTSIRIRAFNPDVFALETSNLKGNVDFDQQYAQFEANGEYMDVNLPHNRYSTTADEFDWDMAAEQITFKIIEGQQGQFVSTDPNRDSLNFTGKTATFDLKTSFLDIGGVENIISADAFVYPAEQKVLVKPGGDMDTLYDARIVADTLTQFHVINRATVHIKGRKDFQASGFYEYNVGPHTQEIEFSNIVGQRVGKGSASEKRVATRGTGEVTPRDRFYIDDKTEFRGIISLSSETRNLQFNGFARLDADLETRHWFSVNSKGDRSDLKIRFEKPKNYEGESLLTGLFLSKETARIYPRIMSPLYFRKDRPVFPVTGLLTYDEKRDQFILGDSAKVVNPDNLRGNKLIFSNKTGEIDLEGRFMFGDKLTNMNVDAAGIAATEQGVVSDTLLGGPLTNKVVAGEFMVGVNLNLPEDLMKMLKDDFANAELSMFDAGQSAVYATDIPFYQKAIAELFDYKDPDIRTAINGLALNKMEIPKKANNYTFLFSKIPMKWDPDYQSFVSTENKIAVASFDGESVNKKLDVYLECKMPQNDDDRLYLYVKGRSGFYYYFDYRQGILSIVSDNPSFNDAIINMKDKDRVVKNKSGVYFEIQPVNPGTATAFLNRIKAVAD